MLTVMITCYNQKDIIGKTIDSIINQETNQDYQILISDDQSTDGSYEYLLEYTKAYKNVFVIQTIDKHYVGHNRNNLIANVNTEYCLFVDGDDVQQPNYIDKIINTINETKKDIYRIAKFKEIWSDHEVIKDSLNYSNFMLFVYKTSLLKTLTVDPDLMIGEDVEFEFRNYKVLHKEVNIIDACYQLNRQDENQSLTKNGDIKKRYELEKILYDKIKNYEEIDPYVKSMVNRKKVELINFATLTDKQPDEYQVNTKNIGNKYLACYIMYKWFPRRLFKLILDKKIGTKF
jgi:glycosyltransferase involved in cell wall biosynthesis